MEDLTKHPKPRHHHRVKTKLFSRNVLGGEVGHDAVDEVFPHDDRSNRLPISRIFSKKQADGFQGHLHYSRRIAHRSYFDQVLLLYRFDGCIVQSPARSESESTKEKKQKRRLAPVTHAAGVISNYKFWVRDLFGRSPIAVVNGLKSFTITKAFRVISKKRTEVK